MSVEAPGPDQQEQLVRTRLLRLTVGIVLSVAAAFGIKWTFSFMTPMLVASFLVAPTPRPTIKALIMMPVMIATAFSLALFVSAVGLTLPILALLSISLLMFRCYYSLARGMAPMFAMWALIGTLLIPVMSLDGMGLAVGLTMGIFWAGMIAMGFVWLAHILVPDPPGIVVAPNAKKKGGMNDLTALQNSRSSGLS